MSTTTRRLQKTSHRRTSSSPSEAHIAQLHTQYESAKHSNNITPPSARRRLVKPQPFTNFSPMTQQSGSEHLPSSPTENETEKMERTKEFARRVLYNDSIRPPGPLRLPSYSKRHASFDSPREVALPPSSPSSHKLPHSNAGTPSNVSEQSDESPFFNDDSSSDRRSVSTAATTPCSSILSHSDHPGDEHASLAATNADSKRIQLLKSTLPHGSTPPIFPFARPYSLPEGHSNSYNGPSKPTVPPDSSRAQWTARNSSASLPLPMQTPYSTLPQVDAVQEEGREWHRPPNEFRTTSTSTIHGDARSRAGESSSSSTPSSDSSGTLPPTSRGGSPNLPPDKTSAATALPLGRTKSTSSRHSTPIRTERPISASSSTSYPPPAPPTILDPATLPEEKPERPKPTYESFLSHVPPPEDSWIAVETTISEYKLVIRLPGFKRDGITLATRRRRILHVVADSWEASGGHFERRIAFGYDADLAQVRAEFNGDILTVTIPRRPPPSGGWALEPAAGTLNRN